MKRFLPQCALVLAMVLWSSSFIALKFAFTVYDPMVVIFGRMFVGTLCFLLLRLKYRSKINLRRADIKLLLLLVFCEPCLYFVLEAHAIVYTTASQAGMITGILPVLVMIAATFFLGEKGTKTSWFGALMAVAGVILLTLGNKGVQPNAPNPVLGNSLEFLAMLCGTGFTISSRKLSARYSPFFLTALQAMVGSIFYFPILFLPTTELPHIFSLSAILAILYLGAVVTLGAYGSYNYALQKVPASQASVYVNLIPVFSVLLGWAIFDERLTGMQLAAGVVVLVGVCLVQRGGRKRVEMS